MGNGGFDDSSEATNFISPSLYYQPMNHGVCLEPATTGSNTGGKVLFTATQWQELEMQMMIYKYIMASIPVPPHLLLPLSTQSNKGGMDLRFSSGSDPEPWRCRRTDGKKWRCSRDVAPDQKYCERHAHKNRPRSRKPVEIQSHNTNVTHDSSYQHPRGTKRTHIFPQDVEENQDSHFNYSNLQLDSAGARRQHFIDAWSKTGGGDNCSLTLSMQCSGGIDGGGGDDRSLDIGSGDVLKLNNININNQWLSHDQGSWMGSPPGGPLGEVLGLGLAGSVNGPPNVPSTSGSCDHGGSHDHEFSFIR